MYSLEYTDILMMSLEPEFGGHDCVLGHFCAGVIPGYVSFKAIFVLMSEEVTCATVNSKNENLGSHCCTTVGAEL
jgi:hypothetical protein